MRTGYGSRVREPDIQPFVSISYSAFPCLYCCRIIIIRIAHASRIPHPASFTTFFIHDPLHFLITISAYHAFHDLSRICWPLPCNAHISAFPFRFSCITPHPRIFISVEPCTFTLAIGLDPRSICTSCTLLTIGIPAIVPTLLCLPLLLYFTVCLMPYAQSAPFLPYPNVVCDSLP